MPVVSVVIPVYNGSKYLSQAIESALQQSYPDIEVLVVNDGSKDNGATDRIARQYGDRVRYFSKSNGGVASALNLAISHSSGQYISWLSHDDVYLPQKIESQIKAAVRYDGSVILFSDFEVIDSEGGKLREVRIDPADERGFRPRLMRSFPLHGCTLLIPKRAFQEVGLFDEKLRTTQDYDLWFKMARRYRFVHVPEILIQSRDHAEQGTKTLSKAVRAEGANFYYKGMLELRSSEIEHLGLRPSEYFFESAEQFAGRDYLRAACASLIRGTWEMAREASPEINRLVAVRSVARALGKRGKYLLQNLSRGN